MKKKSTLLLILLVVSCISMYAQSRWIEDFQMQFRIAIPASYHTNEFWDGTDKIHAFVSSDQNVAVRVRSIPVDSNVTVDMVIDAFSENIIRGAQLIVNREYVLNRMKGKMAAYRWTYNNTKVVIGAFYTIQKNIAYVVWSIVPESLLAARSAEADAITNSFSVIKRNSSTTEY